MTGRYTDEIRNAAVIRATETDDATAAAEMGIPRRTVSSWRHRPAQASAIVQARAPLVERYKAAEEAALARVEALVRTSRHLGHVTRAAEYISDRRALLTGGVTARTESTDTRFEMTWEQKDQLRAWLDRVEAMTDEELNAEMPSVLATVRQAEADAVRLLHGGEALDEGELMRWTDTIDAELARRKEGAAQP